MLSFHSTAGKPFIKLERAAAEIPIVWFKWRGWW
jgi:hypothetical protein